MAGGAGSQDGGAVTGGQARGRVWRAGHVLFLARSGHWSHLAFCL